MSEIVVSSSTGCVHSRSSHLYGYYPELLSRSISRTRYHSIKTTLLLPLTKKTNGKNQKSKLNWKLARHSSYTCIRDSYLTSPSLTHNGCLIRPGAIRPNSGRKGGYWHQIPTLDSIIMKNTRVMTKKSCPAITAFPRQQSFSCSISWEIFFFFFLKLTTVAS